MEFIATNRLWQLVSIIKSHHRLPIHLLRDIFPGRDNPSEHRRNDDDEENNNEGMWDFALFHWASNLWAKVLNFYKRIILLQHAEAFITLRQKVLNAKGESVELHIDMAVSLSGFYFVNSTDNAGRKCVKKVVKQPPYQEIFTA